MQVKSDPLETLYKTKNKNVQSMSDDEEEDDEQETSV